MHSTCSDRCRPGSPCMVSRDGVCEQEPPQRRNLPPLPMVRAIAERENDELLLAAVDEIERLRADNEALRRAAVAA